jgi:ribosome-associated translation inhibitor RaiA
MLKIIFKNLEKSDLVIRVVESRFGDLVAKFPNLSNHVMYVKLSMDNSSTQAGPDEFGVRVQVKGKMYGDLIIEKKSGTLYRALAEVVEAMLERVSRRADKIRIMERAKSRKAKYFEDLQGDKESA